MVRRCPETDTDSTGIHPKENPLMITHRMREQLQTVSHCQQLDVIRNKLCPHGLPGTDFRDEEF